MEELDKTADPRQYAELYDEVIRHTPHEKRKPKDWALAKKVLYSYYEECVEYSRLDVYCFMCIFQCLALVEYLLEQCAK